MKKRCSNCKCLEEESSPQFYKRTKNNSKAKFYCIECMRVIKKENPNLLNDRDQKIERAKKPRTLTDKQIQAIQKQKDKLELKKEISRFQEICRIEVERLDEERKVNFFEFNKTESAKKGRRRYATTDKGRAAASIRNYKRQSKFQKACEHLTKEERLAIGQFYRNRPEGCHVDHIIPISKGGKHELSNLQYLTAEENLRKSAKILADQLKTQLLNSIPSKPYCKQVKENQFAIKKRNKGSKFKNVRRLVEK